MSDALQNWVKRMNEAVDAQIARRERRFTRCRVAWLLDGVEGYAPWQPIERYAALLEAAPNLVSLGGGKVRAWVERR